MSKNHLKRIAMPKTWKIGRKEEGRWVTKPKPGAHKLAESVSLETIMKEMIKCAGTRKEAKSILNRKQVIVDGKQRKELKLPVGLMDVISLPEIDQYYRMLINKKGELSAVPIKKDESSVKPCKITGKTIKKKGIAQINLFDSRNILLNKGGKSEYNVGDTVMLSLPKQEIKDHFRLDRGASVYLVGGKHIGEVGTVEDIKGDVLRFKTKEGRIFETAKNHAFVVGNNKPAISLIPE